MKLYYVLFSFLIILVVSCTKNTGVVVTNPDSNIVLDKIRYGNFQGVTLNANNVLNISGSTQNNDGTYRFVSHYLTLSADFENNQGKQLKAFPAGYTLYLVVAQTEAKNLLEYMKNLNDSQRAKIYENIIYQIDKYNKLDISKTDEILKDVNLSESERKEMEELLIAAKNSISSEKIKKM